MKLHLIAKVNKTAREKSSAAKGWRKKYDYVWDFSEGLAPVQLNGKWGFINKTGEEVVPLKYDYVWDFSEGLAAVQLNDKWGFIDKTGKEIPKEYLTAVLLGGSLDRIKEIDMI